MTESTKLLCCGAGHWTGAICGLELDHDGPHEAGLNSEIYEWEKEEE